MKLTLMTHTNYTKNPCVSLSDLIDDYIKNDKGKKMVRGSHQELSFPMIDLLDS